MRLLLTVIELLDENGQYAMIKFARSLGTKQIKADAEGQEREIINIQQLPLPYLSRIIIID